MSITIIKCIQKEKIPLTPKAILTQWATHLREKNPKAGARVSPATIAEESGCSESTVDCCYAYFDRLGVLRIEGEDKRDKLGRRKGGEGSTPIRTLHLLGPGVTYPSYEPRKDREKRKDGPTVGLSGWPDGRSMDGPTVAQDGATVQDESPTVGLEQGFKKDNKKDKERNACGPPPPTCSSDKNNGHHGSRWLPITEMQEAVLGITGQRVWFPKSYHDEIRRLTEEYGRDEMVAAVKELLLNSRETPGPTFNWRGFAGWLLNSERPRLRIVLGARRLPSNHAAEQIKKAASA